MLGRKKRIGISRVDRQCVSHFQVVLLLCIGHICVFLCSVEKREGVTVLMLCAGRRTLMTEGNILLLSCFLFSFCLTILFGIFCFWQPFCRDVTVHCERNINNRKYEAAYSDPELLIILGVFFRSLPDSLGIPGIGPCIDVANYMVHGPSTLLTLPLYSNRTHLYRVYYCNHIHSL